MVNTDELPREERYAIAVDLGTTGLKVGLVSFSGQIAWTDHHVLETRRPAADAYEQDAGEWWTVILAMLDAGLATGVVRPDQVRAVTVTGQWASTVPVDENGIPVGPCIVWTDRRGRRHAKRALGGPVAGYAPAHLARWLRRTGGAPPLDKGPLAAHLHLIRDRPDIAQAARWFLEPVDYLTMRFCGTAAASQASMTAHFLVDLRNLDHLAFDADLVRRAGIDPVRLPPLRRTGSVVGTVTEQVADTLGIAHDVPVITGLPDIHTAPAGSGAVLPGEGHLVVSTTSWISCSIDRKKSNLLQEIISIPGPTQGTFAVFDNIDTAGACLDWFRRVVSLDGTAPHDVDAGDLVELAGRVPPGANGVAFAPWLSGAQTPFADGRARAGFHNVTLASGAAELARAVLEGVAVQNALLLESVEKFVGTRLDPLRIIGGGARSDLWCQIHADALDRTIERVEQPLNAGLRGAALNAAMTLGAVTPSEVGDLVAVDTTFRPDPATRLVYRRLADSLRKVHKGQKRALKALNQRG
jgi:xylulokinase